MKKRIEQYIESKANCWADTTIQKELHRLTAVEQLLGKEPKVVWDGLIQLGLKPYSRVTYWTRICDFWDFHSKSKNPYREFRQKNAKLFRNVYVKKTPTLSMQDVLEKVDGILDPLVKERAKALLETGMRFSESGTLIDGYVTGKGGKVRKVFLKETNKTPLSYWKMYRELKKVGLKSHDFRKILATTLAKNGMTEWDLCKVFGWEDFNTAKSYISSSKEEELEQKIRSVVAR